MDWTTVESHWDHYRARVKARWARLSPEHLDAIGGDRIRLAETLRELYGISFDEVEKQILNFEGRNQDYHPSTSSCGPWRRVN
jgi:hypothetical protein